MIGINELAKSLALQKAEKDAKCWVKHALTSSVGCVLLSRQMRGDGLTGGDAEDFMRELWQFRQDVVEPVDDLPFTDIIQMFKENNPELSMLNKPDWFTDEEWHIFTRIAGQTLGLYAFTATEIAKHKQAAFKEALNEALNK